MFCNNDDDIPTMFRRRFQRNFKSKSSRWENKYYRNFSNTESICCVESSLASKMKSRDLGGLFNIAYPTPKSLAQAPS